MVVSGPLFVFRTSTVGFLIPFDHAFSFGQKVQTSSCPIANRGGMCRCASSDRQTWLDSFVRVYRYALAGDEN